ncbi:hypothetical protein D3C71_25810 [compost metagenome]
MSTTTLGATLAATIEDEQARTLEAARRKAAGQSEKAQRELQTVEDFFAKAKQHFIDGIVKRIPSDKLGILVGQTPQRSENTTIYSLLKLYNGRGSTFFPVIKAFEDWAASEGLEVKWVYEHDGGGVHAWYTLTVKPRVAA